MTTEPTPLSYGRVVPADRAVRLICALIIVWSSVVVVRHGLYWTHASLLVMYVPTTVFEIAWSSFLHEYRLPLTAAVVEVFGLAWATIAALRTIRHGRRGFWVEYGCAIAVLGVLFAVVLIFREGSPVSVVFRNPGARAVLNELWRCWSTLANATVPGFCLVAMARMR